MLMKLYDGHAGVAQKWRETFDIVFLIDGSERMNPLTHFSITKYLLKELIDQ
ncbi:hypothetical protein DPMN_024341 [Dreissena polymorpha]|uniref:VWFA domain-containing protein n=1 Tax=Dreissena polymorpha TaxID=45954 RepID=A0A9D4LMS4_DREPO|nr:hypothetical protein DPMN_024341 [Dreissena polymorpha]